MVRGDCEGAHTEQRRRHLSPDFLILLRRIASHLVTSCEGSLSHRLASLASHHLTSRSLSRHTMGRVGSVRTGERGYLPGGSAKPPAQKARLTGSTDRG
jgi:hypothetical protein